MADNSTERSLSRSLTIASAWVHGSADSNDTAAGRVGDYQFAGRKANAVRAYFECACILSVKAMLICRDAHSPGADRRQPSDLAQLQDRSVPFPR